MQRSLQKQHSTLASVATGVRRARLEVGYHRISVSHQSCEHEYFADGTCVENGGVAALVLGDAHVDFIDPGVVLATFTGPDAMVKALKPAMLDTRIGKNESRNTISNLGVYPKPNQMMNNGAMAILGTICRNTTTG